MAAWDELLRGAVAGVLALHGLHLALPGPLRAVRLALCTGGSLWLWLAARALFVDDFAWRPALLMIAAGMVARGPAGRPLQLRAPW